MPMSTTAPTDSSVNVASQAAVSDIRRTATWDTDAGHDHRDQRERQPLGGDRRGGNGGRDVIREQQHLQRLAGRPAHGEEADRVGRQPDAEQAPEAGHRARYHRQRSGRKGDGPSPRAQQVPRDRGQQQHRQGEPEPPRVLQRFLQVEPGDGEGEEGDPKQDRDERGDASQARHRARRGTERGGPGPWREWYYSSAPSSTSSASWGALVATSSRSTGGVAVSSRSSTA